MVDFSLADPPTMATFSPDAMETFKPLKNKNWGRVNKNEFGKTYLVYHHYMQMKRL